MGTHQTKFVTADKRLDKFAGKLERASEDIDSDVTEIAIELDDDPPFAIEAA